MMRAYIDEQHWMIVYLAVQLGLVQSDRQVAEAKAPVLVLVPSRPLINP